MAESTSDHRYSFEQFTAIRRYQPTLSFSPDGSQIAYVVNTSGQYNLWTQPSAGGFPIQLTLFADQAVRDISWSPDGSTIAFTADRDGDEFKQIHTIPARGGRVTAITTAENVRHEMTGAPWSPDGSQLVFAGNDREPTEQDVLIHSVTGGTTRRSVDYGGLYFPVQFSPDGTQMTVVDFKSNTDSNVYVLSLVNDELTLLTAHEGEIAYQPGPWAPDSSGFWMLTDKDREFTGLAFQEVSGDLRWVETPDADIEDVALSSDGRYLVWAVNESGYSALHIRDTTTNQMIDIPSLPKGVFGAMAISATGEKIGLLIAQATRSTEVFVVEIATGTVTQLTESFLGGIDPDALTTPELISYPTHDDRLIPAWLYKPAGDGPFPFVLAIHGGPEAQERPTYNYTGLYQYLLSRGIGILAPNVRGSTGYGKTYQKLIHRDWGGAELGDFKAAAEYLKGQPWVNADRLGVFGGSFGGFATLSCVSRLPEYWAAAVDIVGPSNLVTLAKSVPPTWRRMMAAWVGDPETEVDFLMERSPITYVDQIKTPLFVIQGANDPRVVQNESDQIVERLRARGVDVKYDVYEDEGHGFTRRSNELKAMGDTAAFLEQHLLSPS